MSLPEQRDSMSDTEANQVWDVLVEHAGAHEADRRAFVGYMTAPLTMGGHEWRFIGTLGFGGKLHFNDWRGAYVNCYPEDRDEDRALTISITNAHLAKIVPDRKSLNVEASRG